MSARSAPAAYPWPADRFELRCERQAPYHGSRDTYFVPEHAMEAARRLKDLDIVARVQIVRIGDGSVLFDSVEGVEKPTDSW